MSDMDITPFLFEGECLVRVVSRSDAPWFVAADVCKVLGLSNPSKAVDGLDADEVAVYTLTSSEGTSGNPNVNVISESGLYALIFRSRKPAAVRFRKWVTQEVLPAIRQTGAYRPVNAEVIPPVGEEIRDLGMDLRIVTECRQTWGNRAAQQMWVKLRHLPTVPVMFEDPAQTSLFSYTAVPKPGSSNYPPAE